ncbi:MAG: hypothetical protein NZ773_15895 [Dehalococcoidia bacterium]|nr:hypothetical protein [Dehalococcoidia bacterium]
MALGPRVVRRGDARRSAEERVRHRRRPGGALAGLALYATAAPTYFPSAEGYIGGGVYTNNPAMCALAQSQDPRNAVCPPLDSVALLSLGAGRNLRSKFRARQHPGESASRGSGTGGSRAPPGDEAASYSLAEVAKVAAELPTSSLAV